MVRYLILLVSLMGFLCCTSTSCRSSTNPDFQMEQDRVDSLEVGLEEDLLHLRIFCSGGIGSCLIKFPEPILANEILIELYYVDDRSYAQCEHLEVTASREDQDKKYFIGSDRLDSMDEGLVIPSGIELDEIYVHWIDFYRS